MSVVNENKLREALEYILQQQLISETFRVFNRTKNDSVLVAGTKANYIKIKEKILGGIDLILAGDIDSFINYLSEEFKLPKTLFEEKLRALRENGFSGGIDDPTMVFMQVTGVLREYWQDLAYEKVVSDVLHMVIKKGRGFKKPSREALHELLSSRLGSDFSLMVNLYVVRLWSQITGVTINFRGPWLSVMNRLTAASISILKNNH
ncbi:MAG: hypothetical protein ACTSUE_00410 [Promethearchaeota archaeon]